MDRRDRRRKRRVRNQIISYIVAVVLLAGLVTGGFFGVRHISNAMEEKKQQEESQSQEESLAQAEAMDQTASEADGTGEETSETESVESQEEILEELVEACVADMSLEDKVAGLFIITPEQLTGVGTAIQAGEGTQEALKKYPVGGLVYFAKNIQSADQLKEMLAKKRSGRFNSKKRKAVALKKAGSPAFFIIYTRPPLPGHPHFSFHRW